MTPLNAMLFSRRALTVEDEEIIRDAIKECMLGLDGVADVPLSPDHTVELSDEIGRDAMWKRGFNPDVLDRETE